MSETGLKPANENPWYVLMTLYGEQTEEEVNPDLHIKNRAVWNIWAKGTAFGGRNDVAKLIPDFGTLPLWQDQGKQIGAEFYTCRVPEGCGVI